MRQHSSRERKRRRSKLKTLRGQRRMSLRNIDPTKKINKTEMFTCTLHFELEGHDSVAIKQDDRTKNKVDRLEQNQRPVWISTLLRQSPSQPGALMVRLSDVWWVVSKFNHSLPVYALRQIHHQVLPLPWRKMERKKERECITMIPLRWSWNPSWRLALAFFLQTNTWRANRNQIHKKSRRKPYWFFYHRLVSRNCPIFVIKAMIHIKIPAFQEVIEKKFKHGYWPTQKPIAKQDL